MARSFNHLTKTKRIQLEALLRHGISITNIAKDLGVHRSTIYREIKRGIYVQKNSDWTTRESYSPEIAHKRYEENLREKGPDLKIGKDIDFANYVEMLIADKGFSPGAALAYISEHNIDFSVNVSKATLYKYIDNDLFLRITNKSLPVKSTKKKKYSHVKKQKRASVGTSIEMRPKHIESREEFGHWEMDSVIGKKGVSKKRLVVLTERKTRCEIIFKVNNGTTESVVECLDKLEHKWNADFQKVFKTITVDNGTEFADFKNMERSVLHEDKKRVKVYYCHAYSSWERGSNENNNKFIRRKIPKGTNFDRTPHEVIQSIEDFMNEYPREMFKGKSSKTLFKQELNLLKIS